MRRTAFTIFLALLALPPFSPLLGQQTLSEQTYSLELPPGWTVVADTQAPLCTLFAMSKDGQTRLAVAEVQTPALNLNAFRTLWQFALSRESVGRFLSTAGSQGISAEELDSLMKTNEGKALLAGAQSFITRMVGGKTDYRMNLLRNDSILVNGQPAYEIMVEFMHSEWSGRRFLKIILVQATLPHVFVDLKITGDDRSDVDAVDPTRLMKLISPGTPTTPADPAATAPAKPSENISRKVAALRDGINGKPGSARLLLDLYQKDNTRGASHALVEETRRSTGITDPASIIQEAAALFKARNLEQGLKKLELAGMLGSREALLELGTAYSQTEEIPRNYEKAFTWYVMATELHDDADAQRAIDALVKQGLVAAPKESSGPAGAQSKGNGAELDALIAAYKAGSLSAADEKRLASSLLAAATRDKSLSLDNSLLLGKLYYMGKGVPQSYFDAYKWLQYAIRQSSNDTDEIKRARQMCAELEISGDITEAQAAKAKTFTP